MTRKIVLGLLGVVLVILIVVIGARILSGEDTWICKDGQWVKHGSPRGPMPTGPCKEGEQAKPPTISEEITLPNPASKNCLDKGGKLESLQETAGTLGICKFDDGTECEEWQFFRGECKKGQFTKADTFHSYNGTIKKVSGKYIFKDATGNEYTLELAQNAPKELKERLESEVLSEGSVIIVASENPPLSKKLVLKSFQEK